MHIQAQTIERARTRLSDAVNALAKLRGDGKLTDAEVKLIEWAGSDETEAKLPIYSSMQHCAAHAGVPVPLIKLAKRAGCGAFVQGSRVALQPLLKWLFTNLRWERGKSVPLDFQEQRAKEAEARTRLLNLEIAEKAGDLMPTAEVKRAIAETHLPIRQRFLALPNEACAQCNPQDPALARAALLAWSDAALATIRAELAE